MAEKAILKISGLSKSFGGIRALQEVSFQIPGNSLYGVIGPNGAGKTTLFNTITGFYPPDKGSIIFRDQAITGCTIDQIVKHGITRTFQNIRLFGQMTALENVMVGQHVHTTSGIFGAISGLDRDEESMLAESSQNLLAYVGLSGQEWKSANTLSYGNQRKLEIARALAARPSLIALDEPAAGMNPSETSQLKLLIEKIHGDGVTIFIIEHDMKLMMNLCKRILVLDHGEVLCEGAPDEVRQHPRVIEAYLGTPNT